MITQVKRAAMVCVMAFVLFGCAGEGVYPISQQVVHPDDPVLKMKAHDFHVPAAYY